MKNKKIKLNKGFTLIEVIIAVTIVVILSSLAVPKVVGYINKAKDAKAQTIAKQIHTAVMWSYVEEGNKFDETKIPTSIEACTEINNDITVEVDSTDNNKVIVNFVSDNRDYSVTINALLNTYEVSSAASAGEET